MLRKPKKKKIKTVSNYILLMFAVKVRKFVGAFPWR
jgi:hypothetical protein